LNEFAPSDGGGAGENPYDPLSFPEFKTMLTLRLAGNTKGITVNRGSDSGMAKISINASHRIVPLNIHGVANAVKFIKNVKSKEIPESGVAKGELDEARKRKTKRKAKSKRHSSSNRSPVPRFYGAWGFGGEGEGDGGGE